MLEHKESFWMGGNSGIEQIGIEMNLFFKRWNKRRVKEKHVMYDLVDYGTSLEEYPPKDIKKHKKKLL